jgi:hypothetical protein
MRKPAEPIAIGTSLLSLYSVARLRQVLAENNPLGLQEGQIGLEESKVEQLKILHKMEVGDLMTKKIIFRMEEMNKRMHLLDQRMVLLDRKMDSMDQQISRILSLLWDRNTFITKNSSLKVALESPPPPQSVP